MQKQLLLQYLKCVLVYFWNHAYFFKKSGLQKDNKIIIALFSNLFGKYTIVKHEWEIIGDDNQCLHILWFLEIHFG